MTAATPAATPPRKHRPPSRAWLRFRAHRRGWVSLWLLVALYGLSLAAELVCNEKPLLLHLNGRTCFPAFVHYTQDDLLGNGVRTRMTDYAQLLVDYRNQIPFLIRAPFHASPHQTFTAADITPHRRFELTLTPFSHAAAIQLAPDLTTLYAFGDTNHFTAAIAQLGETLDSSPALADAIAQRLANQPAPAFDLAIPQGTLSLAPFPSRTDPPSSVRILFRSAGVIPPARAKVASEKLPTILATWQGLSRNDHATILAAAETAAASSDWVPPVPIHGVDSATDPIGDVSVMLEPVAWPFRPVPGHPMGFDNAGRDVFARVLYALRLSMTFGLALVVTSMLLGIAAGAIQGYFAGWMDLAGQRLTEIWSALPFLYVILLLGNVFGRSFGLLLTCYALFNWIGIAAYVRAEFLRLRTRAFVDAARCQGLSGARIMFFHILPNTLTPLITLAPFALVGAIGSLAVLDYLGFGLPAGSPSWGELLNQAQTFRSAWWLILYPSLALFTVILLGVFVGEGIRDALDPRPYSKME